MSRRKRAASEGAKIEAISRAKRSDCKRLLGAVVVERSTLLDHSIIPPSITKCGSLVAG
jgi:hypothetical protein